MLRILAALVLVIGSASAQEVRVVVHALEVLVEYGNDIGDGRFDRGAAKGSTKYAPIKGLRMRARTVEAGDGDSSEWRMQYSPLWGFGFQWDVEDDRVEISSFNYWHRGNRHSMTSVQRMSPEETMDAARPYSSSNGVSGGNVVEAFFIVDVIGARKWPRPHRGETPEEFLKTAVQRFEHAPTRRNATFVLDLIRFVPLTDSWSPEEVDSLIDRLIDSVRAPVDVTVLRRGSRIVKPEAATIEQAILVNAPWMLAEEDFRKDDVRGGVSISSYPVYRFIAESRRHAPEARLFALETAIARSGGIGYHDEWIAMLESGDLPLEEPMRGDLIRSLKEEVVGRRPFPLSMLVLGGMGVLICVLFALRFVARRTMFA